jgi:hypothetical protein
VTLAASSERPTWILRLTKLNLGMAGRTRYPGEGEAAWAEPHASGRTGDGMTADSCRNASDIGRYGWIRARRIVNSSLLRHKTLSDVR